MLPPLRYAVHMDADALRAIVAFVQGRVTVREEEGTGALLVAFRAPSVEEVEQAGLDGGLARRLLGAEWFAEMVDEVVSTPAFCDPADPPELVLRFARDVVAEYVWKRFSP